MQYKEGYEKYPANAIRIDMVIDRLKKNNVKTILDSGCGTCGPMIRLLKEGFDVKGFVEKLKAAGLFAKNTRAGADEEKISKGV